MAWRICQGVRSKAREYLVAPLSVHNDPKETPPRGTTRKLELDSYKSRKQILKILDTADDVRCASSVGLRRCAQSGLWFPDIRFVLDITFAPLESTLVAEASSANTSHNVATLTAGNDHMAIGARTGVSSQPIHETLIPFDNVLHPC